MLLPWGNWTRHHTDPVSLSKTNSSLGGLLQIKRNTPPPCLFLPLRYTVKPGGNSSTSDTVSSSHDSVPITISAFTVSTKIVNSSILFFRLRQMTTNNTGAKLFLMVSFPFVLKLERSRHCRPDIWACARRRTDWCMSVSQAHACPLITSLS